MTDLFDYCEVEQCSFYDNGHRYFYDAHKSNKEISTFSCLCGLILNEFEDSGTGA